MSRRHPRLLAAVLASLPALGLALALQPGPATAYDSSPYQIDFAGEELMRLTNLDRVATGLAPLESDPFLIDLARDAAFTCPSTGAIVHGRARDMAANGHFSHGIAGCVRPDGSEYTILDVLSPELGYDTYRAENIAMNNYGAAGALYDTGCDINGERCVGQVTFAPETVTVAERGFMKSAAHRENILGDYDRFGCASWVNSTSGMKYYACLFSRGGPRALDVTPPRVDAAGAGIAVKAGEQATFAASFGDNVRLAGGRVELDSRVVLTWSYWYDRSVDSRTLTVSTARLAKGTHTIRWVVQDVSTLTTSRTVQFVVR